MKIIHSAQCKKTALGTFSPPGTKSAEQLNDDTFRPLPLDQSSALIRALFRALISLSQKALPVRLQNLLFSPPGETRRSSCVALRCVLVGAET